MRLPALERQIIRNTVVRRFGPQAKVWLFGSRIDDEARGGDIDLLIQCPHAVEKDLVAAVELETELQDALGDQKIDILISHPGTPDLPIHRLARQTGIVL